MSKWCYNYDSGEYEDIDKDGFSWSQGEFVYNWDDSEYKREEEEESDNNTSHALKSMQDDVKPFLPLVSDEFIHKKKDCNQQQQRKDKNG